MYEYKSVNKYLNKNKKTNKKNFKTIIYNLFIKLLICILLLISILIIIKIDNQNSQKIKNFLYENNISFARINSWYTKHFGDILPFQEIVEEKITPVFSENLKYQSANIYEDGVELKVSSSYLVPVLEDGIVVFCGQKEKYNNTIIIQQTNGIDVWYANIKNPNVKLYDYVSKGEFLAEANNKLYLVFQKDGKYLNYKDYIS